MKDLLVLHNQAVLAEGIQRLLKRSSYSEDGPLLRKLEAISLAHEQKLDGPITLPGAEEVEAT